MNFLNEIKKFAAQLPKFPDGRIDYSDSLIAPVVNVFVKYKDRILLLKRSDKVRVYQGKWNSVSGYLDELKPIEEKAKEEIKEELGIQASDISEIRTGERHIFKDKELNKTWIIYPVLIDLKNKPAINLDREHTEYKWIKPKELKNYDIIAGLEKVMKNVLNLELRNAF